MAPIFGDVSQSEKFSEIKPPLKAKEESLGQIQEVLDQLEQTLILNGNYFICGPDYSLADCLYTCLLARLSMIDLLKEQIANRPNLAIWWGKVQMRPSFKTAQLLRIYWEQWLKSFSQSFRLFSTG